MKKQEFNLSNTAPEKNAFENLRSTVGWNNPSSLELEKSINNSLFWVAVYHKADLIGTGRVVGDGAMYFYLQDVIVHPDFQGLGLGIRIMEQIEDYLKRTCKQGATIGLFAVQGKEEFYKQFGYSLRDGIELGHGMCKFV